MLIKLILNIVLIPLNLALLVIRLPLKILFFRKMSLWTVAMADKKKD